MGQGCFNNPRVLFLAVQAGEILDRSSSRHPLDTLIANRDLVPPDVFENCHSPRLAPPRSAPTDHLPPRDPFGIGSGRRESVRWRPAAVWSSHLSAKVSRIVTWLSRPEFRPIRRRTLLAASAWGCAGGWTRPAVAQSPAPARSTTPAGPDSFGRARSTILFFLCGGPSHIDTWDLKPEAPAEIRGEFHPIETAAPGVRLCEHLPLLARQAQHLALLNAVDGTDPTNSHLAYYYHLTGHTLDPSFVALGGNRRQQADDWPFVGSVVGAKLPPRGPLPPAISFPWIPETPPDIRAGQFAGRLGVEHDPLYLFADANHPGRFQAPALTLPEGTTVEALGNRRQLLALLDRTTRQWERRAGTEAWLKHQERAFALLTGGATRTAFDLEREPVAVRDRYGRTVNGQSLLLARRLVEAGVPFITVYWLPDRTRAEELNSGGGWDTHGNNFTCLKDRLLPEFDRPFAALLDDLHQRGMLESTMVIVSSEMGRKPKIGDPRSGGVSGAGRDHWTACQSVLLAGGGIRGGQVFGTTDKRAEYPDQNPVAPEHIARTVFHALGIDDLHAVDREGRPFHLMEDGRALTELF